MKYLSSTPFTVTGEQTKQALDNYTKNWLRIFGKKADKCTSKT